VSFDWRKFLELAQALNAGAGRDFDRESAQRSATSRAYYAAFCFARNFAMANLRYVPNRDAEDHEGLRRHLHAQGRGRAAAELTRLRLWRNQCDYDEVVQNLGMLSNNAVKLAFGLIKDLAPSGPAPAP
jgi:hypothetical protein